MIFHCSRFSFKILSLSTISSIKSNKSKYVSAIFEKYSFLESSNLLSFRSQKQSLLFKTICNSPKIPKFVKFLFPKTKSAV